MWIIIRLYLRSSFSFWSFPAWCLIWFISSTYFPVFPPQWRGAFPPAAAEAQNRRRDRKRSSESSSRSSISSPAARRLWEFSCFFVWQLGEQLTAETEPLPGRRRDASCWRGESGHASLLQQLNQQSASLTETSSIRNRTRSVCINKASSSELVHFDENK